LLGKSPHERGRPGTKRHLIVDGHGLPLAGYLTPANELDYAHVLPLVDQLDQLFDELWADRGYDKRANIEGLKSRGITPMISRRNPPGGGRRRDPLCRHRWPVERTTSWINAYRRLLIRWDRKATHHQAFYTLACCLICIRNLQPS
jgi:transposase